MLSTVLFTDEETVIQKKKKKNLENWPKVTQINAVHAYFQGHCFSEQYVNKSANIY